MPAGIPVREFALVRPPWLWNANRTGRFMTTYGLIVADSQKARSGLKCPFRPLGRETRKPLFCACGAFNQRDGDSTFG